MRIPTFAPREPLPHRNIPTPSRRALSSSTLYLYCLLAALTLMAASPSRADLFTSLYSFPANVHAPNGPVTPLLQASDGNLYGTDSNGGTFGFGSIFRIPLGGGPVTTLYSFTGGSDGSGLLAGLIQAADGNLYGVTAGGGANNHGTVFQITFSGTLTTLYSFTGGSDGASPQAPLLQASDGNLYGLTSLGGVGDVVPPGYPPFAGGTVFEIQAGPGGVFVSGGQFVGTFQTLHSFANNNYSGASQLPGLIQASDGNLYGVATTGGIQNGSGGSYGFVYRLALGGGSFIDIYDFTAGQNGTDKSANPNFLIQGRDGNLYGTELYGANGIGGIFEMPLSGGTLTTLYSFTGGADSATPNGLVQSDNGSLYGTTSGGNSQTDGTLFQFAPATGTLTTLYTFSGGSDGAAPLAPPVLASDGNLCGTTYAGGGAFGSNGYGTLWEYSLTYSWSGYLQPINQDGSSLFHLGRTVPVKFQLTGASAGITNAVARLYIAKVSNSIIGTYMEASSTSAADSGNQFRYDPTSGQYIFNLGTSGLSTGTYELKVDLGDGDQNRTVLISLK